ncbi:MAG: iron donor protein CyaY [Rickettsiales bacterium]|nr:iron donor protein CyaY [Rickettsiales bacterium]
MTEQDFYLLSETALTKLADCIEKQDVDSVFDVEYSDGILNVVIEETGQTYVINKHSASQKIWYSSPISGADYFSYDAFEGKWLNARKEDLENKLFAELSQFMSLSK